MKWRIGRRTLVGSALTALVGLVAVAVVAAVGITGWEYSNSNEFCTNACHAVHPEEPRAHATSSHARVNCVECHMGRNSTLHLMALKPTHLKELWGMIVGYHRPVTSNTLRPAREACESCHWPQAKHFDVVTIRKHYLPNDESTELATRLVIHTSMGVEREKPARGVHWHIDNDVRLKSLDPQRREIPVVEVHKSDGTKVVYVDSTSKVSKEALDAVPARRMECFDCHNQVGHPFRNPSTLVDQAIAAGRIDRSLPNAKARSELLIAAVGDLSGSLEERTAKVDKAVAESTAKAAVGPDDREKEQQFAAAMKEILLDTSVAEKGLTWKSFPNHAGHSDSPGCFRCHAGNHRNEKGQAIRLQCTLCHDLPEVAKNGERITAPSTVEPGEERPRSHSAPNFMHEHGDNLSKRCESCHGSLKFGREGGGFCANPACHGRTWPEVNLNVKVESKNESKKPGG